MTYQLGTRDDYAHRIIAEGQRRGIAPHGIVIALAAAIVESDIKVYANRAVPESMTLPHDAVGSDSKSVGLYQQQIVRTANGYWWSDAETCMNPTTSAGLFYQRLATKPYRQATTATAAGAVAQSIQRSAYPNRYAQRMGQAQELFDRLAGQRQEVGTMGKPAFRDLERLGPSKSNRHGARVINFLLHTQEGNSSAENLAAYCNNPNNNASYHYIVDDATRVPIVDTDYASWSVLNANPRSINLCFAGSRAAMTREQWLGGFRNAIRVAAWTIVEDAKKYPYINANLVQARPYPHGDVACVSDHYFVTKALGIGNHTDVGPHFPWDVLEADLREYLGTAAPRPTPAVNRINECAAANQWLGARVKIGHENSIGEVVTPDGKGRFAQFEHGYVYWHPRTGAVAVPMSVFEVWAEHGWERGPLGWPTVAHTDLSGGIVQAFEKGVIYRQTGAEKGFYVTGVIGARWGREGYENGPLGWPTSDEYDDGDGGRRQDFEYGSLRWHPSNAVLVKNVEVIA